MSNNVNYQTGRVATPPETTIVETEDQGSGVQRQVVKVGNSISLAAGTVAIGKTNLNPSAAQLTVAAINFSGIAVVITI